MQRGMGTANPSASGFYQRKTSQFRTRYFELVELIIGANSQVLNAQAKFTDQSQLRDDSTQQIFLKAIETYSNQVVPVSPTGNPVATPAQIEAALLNLNINSYDYLHLLPLGMLNRIYGDQTTAANFVPFVQQLFLLDDITKVIWPKSYVQFASGAGDNAVFSYLFGVHYEKIPDSMNG
jgi:hypothetical protein